MRSSSPLATPLALWMKASLVTVALAVTTGFCSTATAQSYPSRPITIVVPFSAGGPTDTLARIMGERLRTALGQTILIDNTTGAPLTLTNHNAQNWNGDFTFAGTSDLKFTAGDATVNPAINNDGVGAVTLGGAGTSRTVTVFSPSKLPSA